jgi:hypothetical protein
MKSEKEIDLYQRFYNKLEKNYKLSKADIINWTYAGYFNADSVNMTDYANNSRSHEYKLEVDRGVRLWEAVMGKIPMPYEQAEKECVCGVKIIWNHILVEDPEAEETEIIIIGSECIDNFLKISRKRKCKFCEVEIRNIKSGMCSECKQIQKIKCEKSGCDNKRVKRKKYCNHCLNPNVYCPCGENKKTKFKGNYMPHCYECWSMTKSK